MKQFESHEEYVQHHEQSLNLFIKKVSDSFDILIEKIKETLMLEENKDSQKELFISFLTKANQAQEEWEEEEFNEYLNLGTFLYLTDMIIEDAKNLKNNISRHASQQGSSEKKKIVFNSICDMTYTLIDVSKDNNE